jgi:hypothetical protein
MVFFPRPSVPSSSNKSEPTSSGLDERIKVFARGENNEPTVAEKMKLGQRLLPREEQRLHAGSPTDATFVLTNPGGQKRSIQVWLEYVNAQEVPVPPPDHVVLRTSAGQSIPVAEWTKPEPVVWKSPEVRQVEIEGDKPTLSLRVSDYKGDDRELGMQLCWRPDYDLHLFFLAVGVSNYNRGAGVHNLACPADDARAMAVAIRKNCRHLFSRIDCPDPVVDPQATRADVIRAIEGMRKRIAADSARLKLAIVFFAGHGVICEPQYFAFLPQDYVKDDTANVISANDIKDRLGALSCPVLLVLDSCHSGQAALDIFSTTRGSNDSKELEKAVQVFEQQKGGLYVLTACQADELALEDKKVWGHGALCKAMLEILDGAPGLPHSGILTLKDLNDYVGKRVKELIQQATGNNTTVIPAFPPGRLPEAIPIAYFPPSK